MRKDYILFIDSGIGGLSTLSTIIKHKKYRYIYYADNLHAPYGAINQQQIYEAHLLYSGSHSLQVHL